MEQPQTRNQALLCDQYNHDSWHRQPCFALTRSSLYFGLLDSSFVRLKKTERELGKSGTGETFTDITCKFLQHKILNSTIIVGLEYPKLFNSRKLVPAKPILFMLRRIAG